MNKCVNIRTKGHTAAGILNGLNVQIFQLESDRDENRRPSHRIDQGCSVVFGWEVWEIYNT